MKINIDAMKSTSLYKLGVANERYYRGIDIAMVVSHYNNYIKNMTVYNSLKKISEVDYVSITMVRSLLKYAKKIGYDICDYKNYSGHHYTEISDIDIEIFKNDYYEKSQKELIAKYGYKVTLLINKLRKEDSNFGKYQTKDLILIEGSEI